MTFSIEERIEYLKEFGSHSMSYSTLQPNMMYFDRGGIGYIAYMRKWGKNFVLGNPICDEAKTESLIGDFLYQERKASFVQVYGPLVKMLFESFGYYGTQMGIESVLDLENWNLRGKKKQVIRTALNQAKLRGYEIREELNGNQYHEISREWISTRKVSDREIAFLVRPMDMEGDFASRRFTAYSGKKAIGFVFFDPIFKDGEVIGYIPNITRSSTQFNQGLYYNLIAKGIEIFKEEGIPSLNLGLSPLILDTNDLERQESRQMKAILQIIHDKGKGLYNFDGIRFTKSRFKGEEYKVYFCHRNRVALIDTISVFKISRVI